MTSLTKEARAPLGVKPRDAERSKNFFALGLVSWMYTRPGRADARVDRRAVRARTRRCSTPTLRPSRPATTSARPPSCSSHSYQVQAGRSSTPGDVHQHHRQHRAGLGPRRRRPARASCRSSSARYPITPGVGHPPRAVEAQELRRPHASRPRTRSPASAPPSAPPSAATSASPPRAVRASPSSPRRSAWPSASSCRCSIIDIQRGGPSTGPADQDRAGRPAAWPCTAATASRRCRSSPPTSPSHCFDAAIEAVRIALKYRTPVILLSDGYLANGAEPWLLPDVEHAARHLRAVRHRAEPRRRRRHRGLLALPPRPRDPGPPVGPARHARSRAPHRRPREGGRHRATSPTTPDEPRAHGPTCGPPRSPASPNDIPPSRCTATRRRRGARARLGLDLGRHRRRASDRVRGPRPEGRPRPPDAPEPVPGEPRRGAAAATRRCSSPR